MSRFLIVSLLFAAAQAFGGEKNALSHHELVLPNSNTPVNFTVRSSINEHGEKEIVYEFEEIRKNLPETRTDVLYGRDTDGNGFPDAWFYLDRQGRVKSVDQPSSQEDGWDVAKNILLQRIDPEKRSFGGIVFHCIATTVLFSADAHERHLEKIKRLQMDLEELEIRANRLSKANPDDRYALYLKSQVRAGWINLAKNVKDANLRSELVWGFADVAMLVGGGAILKTVGGALKIGAKAGGREAAEVGEKIFERVSQNLDRAAEDSASRLGSKADARLDEEVAAHIAEHSLPKALDLSIRGLRAKALINQAAAKALKGGRFFVNAGLSRWKYIAATQSLQILAEIMDRKNTVLNPNPLIVGERLFSDKGFDQDFAYMTVDTFMQTAASTLMPTFFKKVALCGVISFVDSMVMSLIIKGETDYERVALDTSWEVGFGNAQTQLDLVSLGAFEKLALSTGHSKLVLLGYAEVVVDQFSGYVAYAEATKHIEWVSDHAKSWLKTLKTSPQSVHVEMVPILGELESSSKK